MEPMLSIGHGRFDEFECLDLQDQANQPPPVN
jgi:hypothetical protein